VVEASFGPDRGLSLRDGRPELPLELLGVARFCAVVFRPIVCLCLSYRQLKKEALVNLKLDAIPRCRNRDELTRLIGEPLYAVRGECVDAASTGNGAERPDVIECYESDGCCIDLWFRDDRLVSLSGFVKPTIWDAALAGRPDDRRA
jgi:hypothetical protein